ncbi:hypothetical protein ACHAWF_002133 [Thalassiosira exigua]
MSSELTMVMTDSTVDAEAPNCRGGDDQPSPPSKKRRLDEDRNHNQQSNKRRKKKKGKKNKAHPSKGNSAKHPQKRRNNWVEYCTESYQRIPSNCAAPLRCFITRVEIDEEPLLPKGVAGASAGSLVDCTSVDGKETKDDVETHPTSTQERKSVLSSPCATTTKLIEGGGGRPNIAGPSITFLSSHSTSKVPWQVASKIKVNGEEKKLFIPVERHSSAKGPTKWAQSRKKAGKQANSNFTHLPGGDSGDGVVNPFSSSIVPDKFWAQRKRLFSRYDEGIQLGGEDDHEMWYSVTPESIANHVAERMVGMLGQESAEGEDKSSAGTRTIVILDVFCGCGGNSIAFARLNKRNERDRSQTPRVKVVAVDNNLSRLRMAAHNATIYGISTEDIIFIHADALEVLSYYSKGSLEISESVSEDNPAPQDEKDLAGFRLGGIELLRGTTLQGIFLSPPWGGMNYSDEGGPAGFDPVSSITISSSLEEGKESRSDNENGETTAVTTCGGELLSIAAEAICNSSKKDGVVAYFLPRNTNGVSMSQIAVASGIEGRFEMEQNVVNGKVKTVTAYFSQSVGSLFKK